MTSNENNDRYLIGWDRSNSSLLYVLSPHSLDTSSLSLFTQWADEGVVGGSCPDYQFSTLLRLISDYEKNQNSSGPISMNDKRSKSKQNGPINLDPCKSIRFQSQQYRESINDCLVEFEKVIADDSDMNRIHCTFLSKIHSVFRLSEIFLLPAPSSSYISDNLGRDWLDCPGISTADTIRFLRQYILPPLDFIFDLNYNENMIEDDEQQRITYPSDIQEKDLYWSLVLSLVRRGCLEHVWDVLKTHSLYITASEGIHLSSMSDQDRASSQSLLRDWEEIGSVLLTAPIPGGRSTEYDDGSSTSSTEIGSDLDVDITYVTGLDVSFTDFRFWDVPSENDHESTRGYEGDYPILFTPELALQKYKSWRDYAIHVRRTNRLCRQISQIDNIFQLLCGDWTAAKPISFESWSEQLCAELLYRTPELRPRSIASRTMKLIKVFQQSNDDYANSIVSIMQGNAGRAMTELYGLGGQSGAALPTTLMFLIFNLFVKAGVIPEESLERELDFLLDAAHAIVSSLHSSHPDMGPQLAIRLLLPYAKKSRRVAASMSLILEHYSPTSEQYARTIISLCSHIISEPVTSISSVLKQHISILILEGCISLLIHLYHKDGPQYMNIDSKVQLLLDGIGMEATVLPKPWLGSCYRVLEVECYTLMLSLLQAMVPSIASDGMSENEAMVSSASLIFKAKPMADVIERYVSSSQKGANSESEQFQQQHVPFIAKLLIQVVTIFCMFRENNRPNERAKLIVTCLTDSADAHTSITIQLWLLRVARCLIESQSDGMFDMNGVRILLGRLSELSSITGISATTASSIDYGTTNNREFVDMQNCFQDALVKAIYMNNSKKRDNLRSLKGRREEDPVEQYGKLSEQDIETAKRFVRSMLL